MAKLEYHDLPEDIKKLHKIKEIHKIVKPSHTIISIHLRNHDKINYKKRGQNWYIISS
jgi:hypothetical protein